MTHRTKPWKVLSTETLLDVRYLAIQKQKVEVANGSIIEDYHLVGSPDWAAVVCVTENRQLVLVEQYRHGHGGTSLELPAGIIEPGEDPMLAAARELQEETGYTATEITPLWKTRPEPARHTHWAHFAFAKDARISQAQALDATEDIQVVLRPCNELEEILRTMVHATHIAALLFASRQGLL